MQYEGLFREIEEIKKQKLEVQLSLEIKQKEMDLKCIEIQ